MHGAPFTECGSGSFCLNPSFPPNAQSLICADDQQCTLQALIRDPIRWNRCGIKGVAGARVLSRDAVLF